jgi:hypothetical protein
VLPNGTHQRPHANGSARGRGRLVYARTLIARGQAIYPSRIAAWVCSASRGQAGHSTTRSSSERLQSSCIPGLYVAKRIATSGLSRLIYLGLYHLNAIEAATLYAGDASENIQKSRGA